MKLLLALLFLGLVLVRAEDFEDGLELEEFDENEAELGEFDELEEFDENEAELGEFDELEEFDENETGLNLDEDEDTVGWINCRGTHGVGRQHCRMRRYIDQQRNYLRTIRNSHLRSCRSRRCRNHANRWYNNQQPKLAQLLTNLLNCGRSHHCQTRLRNAYTNAGNWRFQDFDAEFDENEVGLNLDEDEDTVGRIDCRGTHGMGRKRCRMRSYVDRQRNYLRTIRNNHLGSCRSQRCRNHANRWYNNQQPKLSQLLQTLYNCRGWHSCQMRVRKAYAKAGNWNFHTAVEEDRRV